MRRWAPWRQPGLPGPFDALLLDRLALRFTSPREPVVRYADLGALALLAEAPRDAADLLHLHHSTVARRLEQIGTSLGGCLTEPAGLVRARLALAAWRLLTG
ncbi:helix-turn-helix domain-containing protein [Nonomuraea africana]|uniref:helix-turn-helix domain-containing protein n=1 Tax=Nonomuraea africana TaxID=46171 RepID=UPI003409770D